MAGPGPFYATLIFAGIPILYLLLLPYLDRSPSLRLTDRPITFGLAILGVIFFIGLSAWGALTPGVAIPTQQVLAFFLLPIFTVLPLVYYLSRNYQKTGLDASLRLGDLSRYGRRSRYRIGIPANISVA